jgi:hypothetical protein
VASLNITVLWDMTAFSLVQGCRTIRSRSPQDRDFTASLKAVL